MLWENWLAKMSCGLLLIKIEEPPYRYDKFLILLQFQQMCTRLGLYLGLHLTSWVIVAFGPPARVNICDTITSLWTYRQTKQLHFSIRVSSDQQALIGHLSWTWLHVLGSADQLHVIFILDCLDMFYPMLHWVDDMFYTPWRVCNTCWKLHDCHVSVYFF
jgi:hypothetical protein